MGEFFRGWRRKMGCATLVMASIFTAGWIRCQTIAEIGSIVIGEKRLFVLSVNDKVIFGITQEGKNPHPGGWDAEPASGSRFARIFRPNVDLRLFGAGLATYSHGEAFGRIDLSFPYAMIVIPLILISAILLLWPSRRSPNNASAN